MARNFVMGAVITSIFGVTAQAAGESGAQFLKLGAGARAAAMGNAYSAVADDVTATYWNPAGLAQVEQREIAFMQNAGLVSSQYQYAAVALPGETNSVAFSFYRLDHGSIDRYTNSDVRNGSFEAGSLAGSFTFARKMGDALNFGFTGKYLSESIDTEKASSFAADLGVLYEAGVTRFGATLQHMGPGLKMVRETSSLPQTIRLGASRRFMEGRLTGALDVSLPNDNDPSIHLGADFRASERFFLRGGYITTPGNDIDVSGLTNITGGVGVVLGAMTLDYAFVPFGDLGATHRVSLLYRLKSPN